MNTIVSVASVSTATAIASPSVVPNGGATWNRGASLARAEQMIEVLRDKHRAKLLHLDEDAAARVLEFFRLAASGRTDEAEEEFVIDFIGDHGQSLDWIFCGDPTCMMAKLATGPISTAHAEADPVFAAIDRFRSAHLAMEFKRRRFNHFEDIWFSLDKNDPKSEEAERNVRAVEGWTDETVAAMAALAETVPTTLPGARALSAMIDDKDWNDFEIDYSEEILRSVSVYLSGRSQI